MLLVAPVLAPAIASARGGYRFVDDNGNVLLASVDVQSWYEGDVITIETYVVPTAAEVEALRNYNFSPEVDVWSHVDLEFTVYDFDVAHAEPAYWTDQSGYLRKIGDDLIVENRNPVVRMIGLNTGRWQPDREAVFHVELSGYSPNAYPLFSVDLMSTVYWEKEGACTPMPGLISNNGKEVCGLYGRRAHLDDGYGNRQF
jgi:hypothetical protein